MAAFTGEHIAPVACQANRAALPFWERTIARFCGAPAPSAVVEKKGKRWTVLSFRAPCE